MRKNTQKLVDAWREGQVFREARTWTDGHTIWLHDHAIAWKPENDAELLEVEFTMAGYPTKTTREKLNGVLALLDTTIVQRPIPMREWEATQWVVHQGQNYRRVIHPSRRYRLTYASDAELGEDWVLRNLDKPETKPASEPDYSWVAFR